MRKFSELVKEHNYTYKSLFLILFVFSRNISYCEENPEHINYKSNILNLIRDYYDYYSGKFRLI